MPCKTILFNDLKTIVRQMNATPEKTQEQLSYSRLMLVYLGPGSV